MTKVELLEEARILDRCDLEDDATDIEDLVANACKVITALEEKVAYWKLSFEKQVKASRG